MGQHQPTLVGEDRATAIADLDEFPGELGLQQQHPVVVPVIDPPRGEQVEVLPVLAADHVVAAAELAREQRHALVAAGASVDRFHREAVEVARAQQLGSDLLAVVGGVGADPFVIAGSVLETDEAQVLEPVALRLGHREDHRARQRALGVALDRDGAVSGGMDRVVERSGSGDVGLRPQLEPAVALDDALAKGDRADVPLPHRAHRHDEAHRPAREARLVGVEDDAGVHQRRRGIAVFVAEIGADQPLAYVRKALGHIHQLRDFAEALVEHALGLPVALGKVGKDRAVFAFHLRVGERQDVGHQLAAARRARGRRLPTQVERPDHHARGRRRQLARMDRQQAFDRPLIVRLVVSRDCP